MLRKLLRAAVEDIHAVIFGMPWMRWGIIGVVGLLFIMGTLYRNGWFDMIQLWSFPWRTLPYMQIEWTLFPSPFHVFCTMAGLWGVGYVMVMANRIARDV